MGTPTSFSSLPPELVPQICRDSVLCKKDIIALRLTSKSQGIHFFASERFAKRHFVDISLSYTRYSLQTFVDICKHTIFGPVVRNVELSCARFLPDCFQAESKDLLDDSFSSIGPLDRHDYLDNIRLLVARCDEEEDLKTSGDDEYLLDAAFTALSHWQHPLELSVSSSEIYPLGWKRLYSPDNLGKNARWEYDALGTVALLCRAAVLSDCVVQRLQIEGPVWDHRVQLDSSLRMLSRLSELELNIWHLDSLANPADLEGMVAKLLDAAVNLKTLNFDCSGHKIHYMFLEEILSNMRTKRLQKLTLTHVDLDWFEPFPKRIKTLRHLEIWDCNIKGSLKQLLLSVQKNFPRLEYFLLCNDRPWTSGMVVFDGAQEVKDGINELMQSEAESSP